MRVSFDLSISNVDKHTIDGEIPVLLCNYSDVYNREIITPDLEFMQATATSREIAKFTLQEDDVLITKDSESWEDIAVPGYVTVDLPNVLCGYHLAQIRPNKQLLRGAFLFRAFQAEPLAYQFRVAAKGVTRYGISSSDIASALFPVPPLDEQDTIIRFLNNADRRIRRYIRAKRKLIALLNEQKQIIIQNAVTRGLDPDVPMRDSGVEWLGEIPAHWDVLPLKRAFSSIDYGISDPSTDRGTIQVLTMGNIRDGQVSIPDSGGVETVDEWLLLEPNDLLFNRTNSAELVGKVGLFRGADSKITFASYLVRLRVNHLASPLFMNYLLNSSPILGIARRLAIPSLHQSNLNPTRYGRIQICLPPLEEQTAIEIALDQMLDPTKTAIEKIENTIYAIQGFHTRLIADVVTGKLDVRDAVLLDLPDEDDDLDDFNDDDLFIEDEEFDEAEENDDAD